jgi:Helix-turn-helix domain
MAMTPADRFRWEQELLANPQLTAAHKIVLTRLALHLNLKTGQCNPSVQTLATGACVAERTVQAALSRAEELRIIERAVGGGRTRTTRYTLVGRPKTVHGHAPFSEETLHCAAPFRMQKVHPSVGKGATEGGKPCTAVHPNIDNKENTGSALEEEFSHWYSIYPRRIARRTALKAYKQARSRGASAETLLDGAKQYAAQRADQEPRFTKNPATWLNGDCWLDQPEIPWVDVPASDSGNPEALSMPERMAAAAKRARASNSDGRQGSVSQRKSVLR